MPIIAGVAIVGGILMLFVAAVSSKEEDEKSSDKKPETPSGDQVNVEEIRRLRRELRHQLKIKKNSTGNS